MKTKSGATIEFRLCDRTVNALVTNNQFGYRATITLADLEEAFELLKADLPWLTKEVAQIMFPTGEYGSHPGLIFDIPDDQPIPENYKK